MNKNQSKKILLIVDLPMVISRCWKKVIPILYILLTTWACDINDEAKTNPFDKPHDPAKPVLVNGIGPEKGGYGSRVVIDGSNFGNDPEIVKVYFNEKESLILGIQDNAIYAMVPKQPGEYSTVKVSILQPDSTLKTTELNNVKFKYMLRAAVTTVAGVLGVSKPVDGPALEASFQRPAKLAADVDGSNIIIVDDNASRIRLLSLKDNKVVTVSSVANPFSCSFNTSYH